VTDLHGPDVGERGALEVADDFTELCTCIGCPAKLGRLVSHWSQELLWLRERRWEPCKGCDGCQCRNKADGDDLLCSWCRSADGISRLQEGLAERFTAILDATGPGGLT